jgi:hypothetical protein
MTEPCYNLVYFELAACRLTKLPPEFAQLIPNVRVLNLNYNFLEDVKPLEGLSRVKKLTIIGSRVKGTKGLIKMAQGMPEAEMVDFRYGAFLTILLVPFHMIRTGSFFMISLLGFDDDEDYNILTYTTL